MQEWKYKSWLEDVAQHWLTKNNVFNSAKK